MNATEFKSFFAGKHLLWWIVAATVLIPLVVWRMNVVERDRLAAKQFEFNRKLDENAASRAAERAAFAHQSNENLQRAEATPSNLPQSKTLPLASPLAHTTPENNFERAYAEKIAGRVIEPLDKILDMTDAAIPRTGRRLTRSEFMFHIDWMIKDADQDASIRKTYALDKTKGRYSFGALVTAVITSNAIAKNLGER